MTTVTFGRRIVDGRPSGEGVTIPADGQTADLVARIRGPLLSNPATGQWVGELVSGEETGGKYARRLGLDSAGNDGPPEHSHPSYEEEFEVVAGEYVFVVDGEERTLTAGEELTVPAGTPHTYRNESDAVGAVVVETRPAAAFGDAVRTLFGLAHDGTVTDAGAPGVLRSLVMSADRTDDTVFTASARPIQHALSTVVGPAARLAGYRATDPEYLTDSFWTERVEQPTELWTDETVQNPGIVSGSDIHYGQTDDTPSADTGDPGIVSGSDIHYGNSGRAQS